MIPDKIAAITPFFSPVLRAPDQRPGAGRKTNLNDLERAMGIEPT